MTIFRHYRQTLINNFVETLGIEDLIKRTGLSFSTANFEDIYTEIHQRPELNDIRDELEQIVYDYFKGMELPNEPTIYDHLVLSLRNKDFIATFNWDPFWVTGKCPAGLKHTASAHIFSLDNRLSTL